MRDIIKTVEQYIGFCKNQRRLDEKTLKAYKIDLKQLVTHLKLSNEFELNKFNLNTYIAKMHSRYKAKTVKRKLASIKAFVRFMNETGIIDNDFINVFKVKFREEKTLPKTIARYNLKVLFDTMAEYKKSVSPKSKHNVVRDIAVIELLFATGIRISELCLLKRENLDLVSGTIRINGKGLKERILSIGNEKTLFALKEYEASIKDFEREYFFLNNEGNTISDQSVRLMIKKYQKLAGITQHITPHMFRHTFATLLLEQDVDIRYIQRMLGHSSITITEIYTFVSSTKQKDILMNKNPRSLIT